MKRCQQGKGEKMNKIQGLGRRLKVVMQEIKFHQFVMQQLNINAISSISAKQAFWNIRGCSCTHTYANLEPVIRMSHENISVVDFNCRFAPNFEFCCDSFEFCFDFQKCMTECIRYICLHSTWALWDKVKISKHKQNNWGKFATFEI